VVRARVFTELCLDSNDIYVFTFLLDNKASL